MLPMLHQIAPNAAASLVAAVWQGILLAGLVAVCLRLLPKLSAAVRSAVWTAVLAAVVLLPFAHWLFRAKSSVTSSAPIPALHVDPRWSLALVSLWAVLSLVRTVRLVRSAAHLRSVSRRAVPIETTAELASLLRAGSRSAKLCLSTAVDRPSVAGFFSPRILLPEGLLAKLSPLELEQIVLHEMEHLKRGDDWTNLLQKLALALFPLNPALLWVERRLCLERELACDDGVLRATAANRTGARKAYATCLANLAEHSLVRRGASLALAAWERQSELARRVHRILRRPDSAMGRTQTAFAMSGLLCTVLAGAGLLTRAPQLVSFAPVASAPMQAALLPPASTLSPVALPVYGAPAAQAARATLVSAIMPTPGSRQRSSLRSLVAVKPARRRSPMHNVSQPETTAQLTSRPEMHEVSQLQPRSSTWIVLTRWEFVRIPVRPASGDAEPELAQPAAPLTPSASPTVPANAQSSSPAAQTGPRATPPAAPFSQPAYAAIPTPNGWLVFQL